MRHLGIFKSLTPSRRQPRAADDANGDAFHAAALLRSFEDSRHGWLWSTDTAGRLTYVSPALAHSLDLDPGALTGAAFADLFQRPDAEGGAVRQSLPLIMDRRLPFERIALQTGGAPQWWQLSGSPQCDRAGAFTGYHGYAIDVTEQRESSESASQMAMYDPLTGLPNRRHMVLDLEAQLRRIGQLGGTCAAMLVDLDRFKQVNDSLGHPGGDALLRQVAERLLRIVGDAGKVFRLGGDEFKVILADCDDRGALGQLAGEIIAGLSHAYSVEGSRCIIGASIGIAVAPFDGDSIEDLMRNADMALYDAKKHGRSRFRFFAGELLELAQERRLLESELRDAFAAGALELHYQPIVDAESNDVTGVESLIRWHHPARGPVSPEVFIPIAEEAGLIEPISQWILRQACDAAAGWPGRLRVAVNISPIQFSDPAFPQTVMSALAHSGLPPERLELELTESVFLGDSAETDAMFAALKTLGVRLALDDFGTGYSSLGYLRTAPFDKIKIDQSFVRDATLPGSRNAAIIAAIVALANALDMETTAEGIESFDQLALVRDLGVSHVQGYLYSKAVDSAALCRLAGAGEWRIAPAGPARQRSERRSMYRKVGVLLDNRYHAALIRNLSESGALVEGLPDSPVGTELIVDFGEGQLALAAIRRKVGQRHGIAFGDPLVSDGLGGLCTSRRVSIYKLGLLGFPTRTAGEETGGTAAPSLEQVVETLELRGSATSGLVAVPANLAAATRGGTRTSGNIALAHGERWRDRALTGDQLAGLARAAAASQNPQLKFIIALLVHTGIRVGDLLAAVWDDIDVERKVWRLPQYTLAASREIALTPRAIAILERIARAEGQRHVIVNPRTGRPYMTIFRSWDAVRRKAGVPHVSIHDLRHAATIAADMDLLP